MSGRTRVSREAETTMRRIRHDMRTPLGQIIGYSEMLQEEAEDRGQGDLIPDLEKIRSAAATLLKLTEDLFHSGDGALYAGASQVPALTDAGGSARPQAAMDETGRGVGAGSVLVVDDDPENRDMLTRRLRRSGHEVEAAEDGRSALHRIEQGGVDVVLLDVLMPGMDGFDVLQAIRRTHSVAQLPVIMATALAGSDETVQALERGANDYVTKPFDFAVVLARVETQLSLKRANDRIEALTRELEIRNAFVRKTFGRYVSDDIVDSLLESDEGLEIQGEKRRLSILMADLRGFSSLTETLSPADVVRILNDYLGTMAEVVQAFRGTVDEFIGDAIMAFFGAPIAGEDDAERAAACALAMQLAIGSVNERNLGRGLPAIEMGVGIATGDVTVGNIGSEKRAKYGAIGSAVNLAARIESYTLGGEVLICSTTREALGDLARFDQGRDVHPKGFEAPLRIHRVVGLGGRYDLSLPATETRIDPLPREIPVRFALLDGKGIAQRFSAAKLWAGSGQSAKLRSEDAVAEMSDIRIEVLDDSGAAVPGACYAKVVEGSGADGSFSVHFTTHSDPLDARLAEVQIVAADRSGS